VRESAERMVKVGFTRNPQKVFDEIDLVTARMVRQGWVFVEGMIEDGLGYAHLFFEREIDV
jgi:hypothetical protein